MQWILKMEWYLSNIFLMLQYELLHEEAHNCEILLLQWRTL